MSACPRPLILALLAAFAVSPVIVAAPADADDAVKKDAAKKPESKVPTKPAEAPERVAASWIVISHAEARPLGREDKPSERTKEDAKTRSVEALKAARDPAAKFSDVALKYSDDPRVADSGGKLGIFQTGQLAGPFQPMSDALFGMEIGQVSDVVEVPLGFVILERTKIVEYSAAHILITYKGSQAAKPDTTRTKEQALELAKKILTETKAPGADFAALAQKYSEGPTARKGGNLGIFGAGMMVGPFEKALVALEIGAIGGPVETQFGYHIIRRQKIERVTASHILIQYKGSMRAGADVTRSKDEARKLAEKLVADAKKPDADFAALAAEHSDGPSGPKGGSLGTFERGQMVPAFDDAVFPLKPGQVSGVVETDFGFHVILRTK